MSDNTKNIPEIPAKKKLSGKMIALIAVVCVVVTACAVLLGVYFGTLQDPMDLMEIPVKELPVSFRTTVARTDGYLGHPDLALTDNGDFIVVYPEGHGRGNILLQRYEVSAGTGEREWSKPVLDIPESWTTSQETPTVYRLKMSDGSFKTVLISGCPSWNGEEQANGFNCSVSDGEGYEWTEFSNWYGTKWAEDTGNEPYDIIVAMSSLTQLKDENGNYIDKWMGTFHDYSFTNYYSYLTFENGNAVWSEPQVFIPEQKDYYAPLGLCEMEIVDTGSEWIMIGRANARNSNALACVSTDQGKTWSKIVELPNCLTGDRHKAEYDATTGKWLISFRQVLPGKESAFSTDRIMGAGWVAWVGDTQTLLSLAQGKTDNGFGDALILLGKEKDTLTNIDCGYSGTVCIDGTYTLVSYGEFDSSATNPYIMAVTFKLSDLGIE